MSLFLWTLVVLMPILALLSVGFLLEAALTDNNEDCKNNDYIWALITAIAAILIFAFLTIQSTFIERKDFKREEPYVVHQIVSLTDSQAVAGEFYLRHGYIDEVHRYSYFYQTLDGGIKSQSVNANQTVLFFDSAETPRAEWYEETRKFWLLTESKYTCDIYLPEDALIVNYEVDLK